MPRPGHDCGHVVRPLRRNFQGYKMGYHCIAVYELYQHIFGPNNQLRRWVRKEYTYLSVTLMMARSWSCWCDDKIPDTSR